jgi:hypothetical protein
MRSAFLTGSRRRTDDRRAATWLMTVLSIAVVMPPASARSDDRVPSSLIARALGNELPGTPPSETAIAASWWVPELRIAAGVAQTELSGKHRLDATVFGELAWPIGRSPVADAIAGARARRQRSSERDALVEQIAATWHARLRADELADDLEAQLDVEEADATLDALTGAAAGDRP